MKNKFTVKIRALVTYRGKILLGKSEDLEKYSLIEDNLDSSNEIEEFTEKFVEDISGLNVELHQIVDVHKGKESELHILYHCEAQEKDVDLENTDLVDYKWVSPKELKNEISEVHKKYFEERENHSNFLEKLEKLPF